MLMRATALVGLTALLSACPGSTDSSVREGPLPAICLALGEGTGEGTGAAASAQAGPPEAEAEEARPEEAAATPAWMRHRQDREVLITNAVVMTASGDVFDPGFVRFSDGRISAVGPGDPSEPASPETWVIDAGGRYVTPGLIDTHSHLGVYASPYVDALSDGNEATSPITAHVQAIHSVWPQDPGFMRAIAGGITTLQILPGSANLIGGRGVTLKLHRGARVADDMRFPGALDGIKMACGENPKRVYGERGSSPSTRMASVAMVRNAFIEAQAYRERWDEYREQARTWCEDGAPDDAEPDEPGRDLGKETLAAVLSGEVLVHVHCYRADEMLVQIQLAQEFGYTIRSFHHAVEAYKIRDVLAQLEIATSTWADWWGFKIEAFDAIPENAGLVAEAGARAIIHSDSDIGIQRLNQEAAKAYYTALDAGVPLTDDDALRWITLNPAWALGVEGDTGSLEVGKMADLVIWSGHPFSVYSRADLVFVDGQPEYDRSNADEPWSDFELGLGPAGDTE